MQRGRAVAGERRAGFEHPADRELHGDASPLRDAVDFLLYSGEVPIEQSASRGK